MSLTLLGILGILVMILLTFLGMNMGMSMFFVGLIGYWIATGSWNQAIFLFRTVPFSNDSSYTMVVIPLFVLMGSFALLSVMGKGLYDCCEHWLGRLPGGLSFATLVACGGFGAICGATNATVLTMGNDMRAMGVFVSTGAFGLAVGVTFHSWALLQIFLLLICFLSLAYLRMDGILGKGEAARPGKTYGASVVWCSLAAIVAFVMFRSYSGEVFSAGMHKTQVVVLMVGAVAMLGKMAGGWLATRWGIIKSMVVVLMATTLCFAAGPSSVALLLAGVFLINCTMPVTLYLANVVLEGREGLAFGILAAALIPGYLLATS